MTIGVMIVDDEQPARDILREFLAAHGDVEITAECANGFEAVKAVAARRPDLLLLDVQMPKLDGFEVLDLIGGDTLVIFTTAYDQHAIRAFDVHAVDYLLKPFSADRLTEALSRARTRLASGERRPARELAALSPGHATPLRRLLIRDRAEVHIVPAERIDYVESQDDYVLIATAGRRHLKDQTLAELESQLDSQMFARIHRRFLVNLSRVAKIDVVDKDHRVAVLSDGTRLPISRAGFARLKHLL